MVEPAAVFFLLLFVVIIGVPFYFMKKQHDTATADRSRKRLDMTITKASSSSKFGVIMKDVPGGHGAVIKHLQPDSSLTKAGIFVGDHVVAVNGEGVKSSVAASEALAAAPAGALAIAINRESTFDLDAAAATIIVRVARPSAVHPIGVRLRSITGSGSALIEALEADSPLAHAGVRPGDAIGAINGLKPQGAASASELLKMAGGGAGDFEDAPLIELRIERVETLGVAVHTDVTLDAPRSNSCHARRGEKEALLGGAAQELAPSVEMSSIKGVKSS